MDNPFQPPQADEQRRDREEWQDLVALRRYHLGHELSIRWLASVYAIAAAGLLWLAFEAYLRQGEWSLDRPILYASAGIASAWAYHGMRRLAPWGKWPVLMAAALGLFISPLFIPLNGYGLYLAFSEKGQRVFSAGYWTVIRRTPTVETNGFAGRLIVWILVAMCVCIAFVLLALSLR